ncbi:MAG: hypothetical protein ACRCTP_02480 [Aeromonas popoffii]|uniref:hypothetical protein n=1 Tax=Aeromonas popoffii TaxID=70856 RepID=UPI003F40B630
MGDDIFDQKGMIVGIEEYLEGLDDTWDDRYECGCCGCCGCMCGIEEWDLEDELPPDLQE